ncbi:hypothetical protein CK203_094857 [Vitis vinifera]|uniref:Uncharacterized protein n=1 Tax=Vitis vinifera TaxID=29760 RepID=A0A438DCH2_VITVI|nr:hypothetical protein CK203_094857 [Vitis vinifera]
MGRTLQKQDRGAKPREQSTAFQGAKISHDAFQGANSLVQRVGIFAHSIKVRKFSHRAKSPPGTRVPFSHTSSQISHRAKQGAKFSHSAKLSAKCYQGAKSSVQRVPFSHTSIQGAKFLVQVRKFRTAMPKTRGGLSASPSSPTPRPHQSTMGGAASPPVQDPAIPPSEGGTPSQRRYPTRRPPTEPVPPVDQAKRPASRPPAKRTKFSGPGEPSHAPQAEPPTETLGFCGYSSETVIRLPMIAGPPIEGNLDCRDRSFHSETYFDIEALRQQPELRDSFRLLQRYHMEHLLTPRQFYYPRVVLDFYQSMTTRGLRNPTLIQFTIDGRQGAIGARHIAEALRIPYEPVIQADFREWSSFSQSDMHKVQRRGAILEALFRISEGYYFGPHHLIMTSLLHFEEKVHQKKLQRADGIPLLFLRLLCQILEHLGYPEEPRLERRRHCREDFSLDKWHHLAAYFAPQGAPAVPAPPELPRDEQLPQAQQDEILTDTTPPTPAAHTSVHMPEAIHPTSPLTQGAPPTLSTAQDSIIQQMATIREHQDQIIATQAQHTTILHQIQQHLSMQTPLGHDRSAPSEPLVPDEETIPAE